MRLSTLGSRLASLPALLRHRPTCGDSGLQKQCAQKFRGLPPLRNAEWEHHEIPTESPAYLSLPPMLQIIPDEERLGSKQAPKENHRQPNGGSLNTRQVAHVLQGLNTCTWLSEDQQLSTSPAFRHITTGPSYVPMRTHMHTNTRTHTRQLALPRPADLPEGQSAAASLFCGLMLAQVSSLPAP